MLPFKNITAFKNCDILDGQHFLLMTYAFKHSSEYQLC